MPLRSIVLLLIVTPLVVSLGDLPAAGQAGGGGPQLRGLAPEQIQVMMARGGGRGGAVDEAALEEAALENKILEIIGTLAAGEPGDAPNPTAVTARKNVAELLERQFVLRQQRHLREVADISGRAKRLRETLDKRAAAKRQIVDRRLDELFSDAEGLEWEGVGGAPRVPGGFGRVPRGGGAGNGAYAAAMAQQMAGALNAVNAAPAPTFTAFVNGTAAGGGGTAAADEITLKDQELDARLQTLVNTLLNAAEGSTSADVVVQSRKAATVLVEEQFDLHQQRRLQEIAETEKQTRSLRDSIKRRADAKPTIIERRLNELFSAVDGLGWDESDLPWIRAATILPAGRGGPARGARAPRGAPAGP